MNRSPRARGWTALILAAIVWLPLGPVHAQPRGRTVSATMGRPGDHWASALAYTRIRRAERNGAWGYEVTLRADDGCEARLFWPRHAIDFHGQGHAGRMFKRQVPTGSLYYPSRLTARSLPAVHAAILSREDSYARLADGAIAAAAGFAVVAGVGTLAPLPAPSGCPEPRARPPHAPRHASPIRAPRVSSARLAAHRQLARPRLPGSYRSSRRRSPV